jgi:hypothetical protein
VNIDNVLSDLADLKDLRDLEFKLIGASCNGAIALLEGDDKTVEIIEEGLEVDLAEFTRRGGQDRIAQILLSLKAFGLAVAMMTEDSYGPLDPPSQ